VGQFDAGANSRKSRARAVHDGCIPVHVSVNASRQPQWRSRMIFNLSVKKFTELTEGDMIDYAQTNMAHLVDRKS
jgi:hypothetical protein